MSAYICDADHLGFLGAYAAREAREGEEQAKSYARTLADENFHSIRCRYPNVTGPENWPGPTGLPDYPAFLTEVEAAAGRAFWDLGALPPADSPQGKLLRRNNRELHAVDVLKSVGCFDYQACECENYEASEAFKLARRIRHYAIRRLPGWDTAQWGAP